MIKQFDEKIVLLGWLQERTTDLNTNLLRGLIHDLSELRLAGDTDGTDALKASIDMKATHLPILKNRCRSCGRPVHCSHCRKPKPRPQI